jgi:hypothetical protein
MFVQSHNMAISHVRSRNSSIPSHGQQQERSYVLMPCGNSRERLVNSLRAVREINVSYYGVWRSPQFRFTRHILDPAGGHVHILMLFVSDAHVFMLVHLCYDAVSSAEITYRPMSHGRIAMYPEVGECGRKQELLQSALHIIRFSWAPNTAKTVTTPGFYGILHFSCTYIGLSSHSSLSPHTHNFLVKLHN